MGCRAWSSVYHTKPLPHPIRLESAQRWFSHACPWEETRHSGWFSNYERAQESLGYAASRVCLPRGVNELERLAGLRIYFVGDSVMRQFSQSFLCRLRHSANVVADNVNWSTQLPTPKWGTCYDAPGSQPLRHCFMRDGCVTFANDVRVCYYANTACKALFALNEFRPWLDKRVAEHGAGSHTFVVMTNGMHVRCQERVWFALNASYESNMAGASLARDRFTVVYKDLDATHFPTPSGAYVVNANRSLWDCAAVNSSDPPQPQRNMELRSGLPVAKRLGWRVLETFEASKAEGHRLHATQAPVPSRTKAVDCLHWMLPGVPDLWSDKLMRVLSEPRG